MSVSRNMRFAMRAFTDLARKWAIRWLNDKRKPHGEKSLEEMFTTTWYRMLMNHQALDVQHVDNYEIHPENATTNPNTIGSHELYGMIIVCVATIFIRLLARTRPETCSSTAHGREQANQVVCDWLGR